MNKNQEGYQNFTDFDSSKNATACSLGVSIQEKKIEQINK